MHLVLLPKSLCRMIFFFFFFNDTATTEIYTLSLHDALPILAGERAVDHALGDFDALVEVHGTGQKVAEVVGDRKSTRLNSSHSQISYAVFCLKKKKNNKSTDMFIRDVCVVDNFSACVSYDL